MSLNEVFAAELGANTALLADPEHLLLPLQVTEAAANHLAQAQFLPLRQWAVETPPHH